MFTGIVAQTGQVLSADRAGTLELSVEAGAVGEGAAIGDSICVHGVCLTVSEATDGRLHFDVGAETLRRTTLGELRRGDRVNLEPALRVGDRLGGHFVSGHVDGVGTVSRSVELPGETRLRVDVAPELTDNMIMKGSVAVDGVSLTVAALERGAFEVSLIPHTLRATTLSECRTGVRVNVECDMIGRWVGRFLGADGRSGLTVEHLEEQGF